eukprot:TRINITY_DN794_c1_g1_i1.p1 TRINITY_DN794_c1_g1~~TRINITY_DN794_c1_g1_i1.p1  ORF type:complete len:273 (+),score=114.85 TRINITY_DN794_c1_g1_i1:87-905(+)
MQAEAGDVSATDAARRNALAAPLLPAPAAAAFGMSQPTGQPTMAEMNAAAMAHVMQQQQQQAMVQAGYVECAKRACEALYDAVAACCLVRQHPPPRDAIVELRCRAFALAVSIEALDPQRPKPLLFAGAALSAAPAADQVRAAYLHGMYAANAGSLVDAFGPAAELQQQQVHASHKKQGGSASLSSLQRRRRAASGRSSTQQQMQCTMCAATDTPEWRRGPTGDRTLCNACGLHYAKSVKKQRASAPAAAAAAAVGVDGEDAAPTDRKPADH